MDIIMSTLNEEQRIAVTSDAKYLQISAGPGTGKTSTIAARILNLQYEKGMLRHEVLAISFSRSAKQQLIKKMQDYTGKLGFGNVIEILTFHSLAHRIIRYGIHHGESKFRKGFQTVNTIDLIKYSPSILEGLCSNNSNRELVGKAMAQAYNLVRQGESTDEKFCKIWSDINPNNLYKMDIDAIDRVNIYGKDLITFWKRIEKLEKAKNITDFQGLITESIHLLNKRAHTYIVLTNELRHILVDEYQDTSLSQEELLFSLAGDNKELTVVGDKNQTIYTFNGSNEKNLDRFITRCERIAPGRSEQIQLKKNYRSNSGIIELSNHFIGNKVIEATKVESSNKPVIVNTQSTKLAASFIASEIQKLCRVQQHSYKDICILFRKNSDYAPQTDDVIEELSNYNIPYHDALVKANENYDLEANVQELSDNYPGIPLIEILALIMVKSDNVDNQLVEFIKGGIEQGVDDIEDLLDVLIEQTESKTDSTENKVTIQSVHAAKGQEYPIVFIMYLGDRHFPHGSRPNISEEKRLLYVGITRAMEKLYVVGQHGIQHADFLGQCKSSEIIYRQYNSCKEELKGVGFSDKDTILIRETEEQLKRQEEERKKSLEDMMLDW